MSAAQCLCSPAPVLTRNCAVRSAAWEGGMWRIGVRAVSTDTAKFGIRCYAARRARAGGGVASTKEEGRVVPQAMEEDAFYVLRKGSMVAVYKSLSDCQAQVSSSVGDPAVGVHKGYSLQKDAIEYLISRGLKNPLFCIDAADWKDDLLGPLIACPFQQPGSHPFSREAAKDTSPLKRSKKVLEVEDALGPVGCISDSPNAPNKQPKIAISSCIIEFDGASKGNPGLAGAGAVVRKEDGSVIYRLREGLGEVTNNVAEYRAVILGMRFALRNGFKKILVQGDSKLVCNQLEGLWKTKDQKMIELFKEAKELRDKFLSFKICHVRREFNSDADAQANLAVALQCGEVQEVCEDLV